jgi:hypothetical protein
VLFADQDVLCDEMGFKMPFTKYEGKDLVLWGSAKLVREDAYQKLLSVSHKDRQQGNRGCQAAHLPCMVWFASVSRHSEVGQPHVSGGHVPQQGWTQA